MTAARLPLLGWLLTTAAFAQTLDAGTLAAPQLKSASPARWPPEVEEQVAVTVSLRLTVGADGEVDAAELSAPAAMPFAREALHAATRLAFEPARLNGERVAVEVEYQVVFIHPTAQPSATLEAEVTDAQTGQPLPFASLWLDSAPAAEADAAGRVHLTLPCGSHLLQLHAAGYAPASFRETLEAGAALSVRYALKAKAQGSYETWVHGERSRTELRRVSLRGPEMREVAGAAGDPFKVMMLLPGVGAVSSGFAYPVVRGASPAATAFFFDGVRLPRLFHSYVGPAVVSSELLDSVEFYPGGAPAKYGRLLAGAVEGHLAAQRSEGLRFSVSADLIGAGGLVEVPFERTGTLLTLAGRYSYDQWIFGLMEKVLSPGRHPIADFGDYQVRLEQALGGGTLRALSLGSYDSFGAGYGPDNQHTQLEQITFHRADLRYRHALGLGELEVGVGLADDLTVFSNQLIYDLGSQLSVTQQTRIHQLNLSGRLKWSAQLADRWHLEAGATFERMLGNWVQVYEASAPAVHLEQAQPVQLAGWWSGWLEATYAPLKRLSLTAGARFDAFHQIAPLDFSVPGAQIDRVSLDPRLSLKLAVSDGLSVRASAGYFHQPPTYLLSAPVVDFSAALYGFQKVLQTSVGATWLFWRDLELSADFYLNPMMQLIEFPPFDDERLTTISGLSGSGNFSPSDSGPPQTSAGLAYGADFMLRWPLKRHFFGWLTVSVQRNIRWQNYQLTDGHFFTGTTYGPLPTAFDQTVIANAVVGHRFDSGVSLGVTLHFNTGRPESGQLGSRTQVPDASGTSWLILSRDQVERLPPYFRADLRVSKSWVGRSLSAELYLDVFNATVQGEPSGYRYSVGAPLVRTLDAFAFLIPSLGLKVMN